MTNSLTSINKHEQALRAYKTELDPNRSQATSFKAHADAARFAWNWGLGRKQEVNDLNKLPIAHIKIPTAIDLHRELNRLKKNKFPWFYEVSKCAPQEALRDLDVAFKNLFEHGYGWPKFKSKNWATQKFTLTGSVQVADNAIKLPRLGWIRLKERGYLLPEGAVHITAATVSKRAGKWFVSLQVREDIEPVPVPEDAPTIGIDMGLNTFAVLSDGSSIESPKALNRNERKLKHLQRSVSRKKGGSSNRKKADQKLARHHLRITNIRKDALHKATTEMAKAQAVYVVEDLSVRAMMGNHHLAKSIADAGWSEFVRQLEYKAGWYGSRVVKADRFFPSTKRCSSCSNVKKTMALRERVYQCEQCGMVLGRDLNAAKNLAQWPSVRRTLETPVEVSRTSLKQETCALS